MIVVRSASHTDPGRKRRRNEDSFVCEPPFFAIADGMGGAQAGEVASRLAAAAVSERAAAGGAAGEDRVRALIEEANRRVHRRSSEDDRVAGMGTTMTVALAGDGTVALGHVGDSRAYLARDGRLEQLTQDHSLVAELVRSGKLSPEEAEVHPQRSVITRALGTEADIDVDTFTVEAKAGDVFLLCSDGLTTMVDDSAILSIVEKERPRLDAVARALVSAANRNGGEDNITVVLFEIGGGLKETAELREAPPAVAAQDEEDTLSGLDGVPVLTAEPEPGWDDDWVEAPPRPSRRSRSKRLLLAGAAALALLAIAAALGLWALSRAHFVGAEPDGHLAVYQGFPYDVVGSLHLYRTVYVSRIRAGELSLAERRRLFDHHLVGYDAARAEIARYEGGIVP